MNNNGFPERKKLPLPIKICSCGCGEQMKKKLYEDRQGFIKRRFLNLTHANKFNANKRYEKTNTHP